MDREHAAGEALADVVVGLALERRARRRAPARRRSSGRPSPSSATVDRVVGQPAGAVARRRARARRAAADGAVDVGDRGARARTGSPVVDRRLGTRRAARGRRSARRAARGRGCGGAGRLRSTVSGNDEQVGEVDQPALVRPRARGCLAEQLDPADRRPRAARCRARARCRADVLGDQGEVVDDVLGAAGEAGAQLGVLGRDPDRARVEVADAHHDAAGRDQRGGREAELVGAEHRPDEHVAAGAHAAVDLDRRSASAGRFAAASAGSRRGRSPTARPACWIDDSGEAPVPPSWPAMTTWSAPALATPAATVPTPASAASLTETVACRVRRRAGRRSAA